MMMMLMRLRTAHYRVALVPLIALLAITCGDDRERTGRGMMDGDMMRMMMSNMPPGVAPSDLPDANSRGARLVVRYCGQCHGIPSPAAQSAEDWTPTMRRMIARMERMESMRGMMGDRGMRGGMARIEAPGSQEVRAMLEYLQAHALRAIAEDELPDPESPEASLFREICSRCHALPDPTLHTPEEWEAVVERMRANMRRMEVEEITDEQADQVILYLERAARR